MESTLSDTTLVGATNMFHPNGKIWMKGNYSNGLQDGRWEIYKEDGSLEKTEVYSKGNLLKIIQSDSSK